MAAEKGHVDVIRLLLDRSAQQEAQRIDGDIALYRAAQNGRSEAARLLLDRGARVDGRGKNGSTPLHIAAASGHFDVVRLMLDRGADPRARNDLGCTVLFEWAYGLLDPVRAGTVAEWCERSLPLAGLLQRGADIWTSCSLTMGGVVVSSGVPLELLRYRCAVPLPAWVASAFPDAAPLPLRERRLVLALVKRVLCLRAELHRGPVVEARSRQQQRR